MFLWVVQSGGHASFNFSLTLASYVGIWLSNSTICCMMSFDTNSGLSLCGGFDAAGWFLRGSVKCMIH